jgi:hypothetical protein
MKILPRLAAWGSVAIPSAMAALLLAGCASTKIESTWKSPELASKRIQRFAVFGVSGSPSGRISFEDNLTKRLQERGLPAVPGYDIVAFDERPAKEEVLQRLKGKEIDAALVTRVDRRTTKTETTPVLVGGGAYYSSGFYDYWYAPVAVGSYTTESNEFIVESVLYDLSDNKPLWMARSNTSRTNPGQFAQDIARPVADALKSSGAFGP